MKQKISEEWVLDLVYRYCYNNRLVLPQKNGTSGMAMLRIVDVLREVRGVSSMFELLHYEQEVIT